MDTARTKIHLTLPNTSFPGKKDSPELGNFVSINLLIYYIYIIKQYNRLLEGFACGVIIPTF